MRVIFVMDNASIHKDSVIRPKIEGAMIGGVSARYKLWYLPPYSPMLNPIEEVFGCFKREVRRLLTTVFRTRVLEAMNAVWGEGRNTRDVIVREAIDMTGRVITPQLVQAIDRRMWETFVPLCLDGKAC
jgi:hypothetical protein